MLQRTDVRLDSFMVPCFLAIIVFHFRGKRIIQYAANPMVQWAIILSFFVLSFAPQFIHSAMFMERAFVPLLITLVVIGTVINPHGWLGRILETPGLRWIGRLSYRIYLWQEIVIYRQAPPQSGLGHIALLFLLRLPILFALAIASYYWIEVPFIRLGRRLAKRASAHLGAVKAASAVPAAAFVE
jgi:peptidoglycan/LPS O-acetylase OafA/YrhL